MALLRMAHTATLMPNGQVLVTGGEQGINPLANDEIYDPATNTWFPTGLPGRERRFHAAVLLHNGKVLVAGGLSSNTGYSDDGGAVTIQ